jgi:hypothetical protein
MRLSVALLVLSAVLCGCGGQQLKPATQLPVALIPVLPAQVGVIVTDEMRKLMHSETRWGTDWQIDLGTGHAQWAEQVFRATFKEVRTFSTVDAARGAAGLAALFEPRIDQFSFATARDTGGRHHAVTIRYRINLYTPAGQLADTLTLTGYGNALAEGVSNSKPVDKATVAAMRDAAAKFLVQFPQLATGQALARGDAVVVQAAPTTTDREEIAAVPIEEEAS